MVVLVYCYFIWIIYKNILRLFSNLIWFVPSTLLIWFLHKCITLAGVPIQKHWDQVVFSVFNKKNKESFWKCWQSWQFEVNLSIRQTKNYCHEMQSLSTQGKIQWSEKCHSTPNYFSSYAGAWQIHSLDHCMQSTVYTWKLTYLLLRYTCILKSG